MIICKRHFGENRCIYFLITEEKNFFKYMEILQKVINIIENKFNSELIYSKKTLKAKKKKHKRRFSMLICTNDIH